MRFLKNISFLFSYSWNISKRRFGAAVIQIFLNTVEPFIYLIFPKFIIDELVVETNWYRILWIVGLFIVCIIIMRVLQFAFGTFINMSINRSDVKNSTDYAKQFLNMDFSQLEDEKVRDLQQKVSTNMRENIFVEVLTGFTTSFFKMIGYSYILSTLDPIILVVVFITVIINYCLNRKSSKDEYNFQPILARFTRFFDYLFLIMTNFDYAKEVRINKIDCILNNKFESTIDDFNKQNKRYLIKRFSLHFLTILFAFVQMILSYGYTAYSVINGAITIGSFSLYIGAIYNLADTFNGLVDQFIKIKQLSNHVNDYHNYVKIAKPQNEVNEVIVMLSKYEEVTKDILSLKIDIEKLEGMEDINKLREERTVYMTKKELPL